MNVEPVYEGPLTFHCKCGSIELTCRVDSSLLNSGQMQDLQQAMETAADQLRYWLVKHRMLPEDD